MAFYISQLDPLDFAKYRNMLHTLYPARSDALYEQMELEQQGYSSSSTKQLTSESVRDQIKSMLRRRVEPNLRGFHRVLSKYDVQGTMTLTQHAFLDALMEVLPSADRALAIQQYVIAEKDFGGADKVSVERCAQIVSYAFVCQCNSAGWGIGTTQQNGSDESTASQLMSRLGTQSAMDSTGENVGAMTGLPAINPNVRPSNVAARGTPARAKGMPMVWHLQDDLGVNAKLEPDEVDKSDMRRIEKVLLAFSTGSEDAAAVISKVQEMIGKGSAAQAATIPEPKRLQERTLSRFVHESDGNASDSDESNAQDDDGKASQESPSSQTGGVVAGASSGT